MECHRICYTKWKQNAHCTIEQIHIGQSTQIDIIISYYKYWTATDSNRQLKRV